MTQRTQRLEKFTLLSILVASCLFSIGVFLFTDLQAAILGQASLLDFEAYLLLASAVLDGVNPYTVSSMQTLGPPLAIVPFVPFTIFPLEAARSIFTVLQLVSGFVMSWLLACHFFPNHNLRRWCATSVGFALILVSFPTRFSLLMGQPNLTIALGVTAFLLAQNSRSALGAVGSLLIKQQFGLLLLSFWRAHRKQFWYTVIASSLAILLTLPLIKPTYYLTYFHQTFAPLIASNNAATNMNYYNQTLIGTFDRFGISLSPIIVLVAVIISVAYLLNSGNRRAAVILSILLAPVVWQHYFIVLFPVLALAWQKSIGHPVELGLLAIASIGLWIELPFAHLLQPGILPSLLASHYFLSSVLLLIVAVVQEKRKRVLYLLQ